MPILNFITNILSWFVKNMNMIVGVIGALSKVAVAILNIFQPNKDGLVDKISSWTEIVQKFLFKLSSILKNFAGS